jgi:hypothetical protein
VLGRDEKPPPPPPPRDINPLRPSGLPLRTLAHDDVWACVREMYGSLYNAKPCVGSAMAQDASTMLSSSAPAGVVVALCRTSDALLCQASVWRSGHMEVKRGLQRFVCLSLRAPGGEHQAAAVAVGGGAQLQEGRQRWRRRRAVKQTAACTRRPCGHCRAAGAKPTAEAHVCRRRCVALPRFASWGFAVRASGSHRHEHRCAVIRCLEHGLTAGSYSQGDT